MTEKKKTTVRPGIDPKPVIGTLVMRAPKVHSIRFDALVGPDEVAALASAYITREAMEKAGWPAEPKRVRYTLEVIE